MVIFITVFISLLLALYLIYQRLRFKIPPGPKPWPIVGNLKGLKPVLFRCFNEWSESYGPIISVWLGSNLSVVVSSSELAKQVLKEHDQVLANRYRTAAQDKFTVAGEDLIWADIGPHHTKLRKMCTLELFSLKKVDALRPIREDEVIAMIESIHKDCINNNDDRLEKSLVLRKYLQVVSLNNITRLVLGKRFVNSDGELDEQGREFKAIVADGGKIRQSNLMAEHIPWLRWILPSKDHEYLKLKVRRDQLSTQIMEEHTKARLESGNAEHHFVDALLMLKDEYGLTDDAVIGLLWNMIVAGKDTIAIAVEWAMAELLRNPRVLQKAQEELDEVIGTERVMTEDDISNLTYLQAIVKEVLRLHPPSPLMLPHKASAHVKIGQYDIPKGTTVYVNVWAIGRDPSIWTNPIQFRPERFLEADVDMRGSDFRLLPFGAGRRVCIGAQLGVKLVTSMLGHLLHQFNWCPPEGVMPEQIDLLENDSIFVSYMATPLRAHATPRLSHHLYKRTTPFDM